MTEQAFHHFLAEHLRAHARSLAERWLEALDARRPEPRERIFPTGTLLNSIPALLRRLADALEGDGPGEFGSFAEAETRQLAELRSEQGYAVDELVAEFDLLEHLVFETLGEEASDWDGPAPPRVVMDAAHRLNKSLTALSHMTVRAMRDLGQRDRDLREDVISEFSRVLDHELRNRLGSAVLAAQLIRESEPRDAEVTRILERLENSLGSLENLVEEAGIFALSTFERPDWSEFQKRSLRTIVATVIGELVPAAQVAGVEIRAETESIPLVPVDRARVKLILANIVGNAIKYADRGQPQRWVEIRAGVDEARQRWEIEIEDNGPGIPKSLQTRVFDERMRAEEAANEGGRGLGLALVRQATDQLGGELQLYSEPGRGSRFVITGTLPRENR